MDMNIDDLMDNIPPQNFGNQPKRTMQSNTKQDHLAQQRRLDDQMMTMQQQDELLFDQGFDQLKDDDLLLGDDLTGNIQ